MEEKYSENVQDTLLHEDVLWHKI